MSASDHLNIHQVRNLIATTPYGWQEDEPLVGDMHPDDYDRLTQDSHPNFNWDDLADSIGRHGVKEPLEVFRHSPTGKMYLYDGHHRAIMADRMGLKKVPATITDVQSLDDI